LLLVPASISKPPPLPVKPLSKGDITKPLYPPVDVEEIVGATTKFDTIPEVFEFMPFIIALYPPA